MKLFLQQGDGMMGLCEDLVTEWGGGTVILSPRDMKPAQIGVFADRINRLKNGEVLVDPQFYLPDADHACLISHNFWIKGYSTGAFFAGPQLHTLLGELETLNRTLSTSAMILPGILCEQVTDDWLNAQQMILAEANERQIGMRLIQTIALSADACRDDDQIARLLEHSLAHSADGYYLVCEHPQGSYLVDDEAWLSNLLDLVSGLKLNGGHVIVGYCNQQMLIAGAAKADAIASGNWMNVRSFPPAKFRKPVEDQTRRKAIWYYCPQALSEYKLTRLDLARKVGVLNRLAAPNMDSATQQLFSGGQPTNAGFRMPDAFSHFLKMLKIQAETIAQPTYEDTINAVNSMVENAGNVLNEMRANKISADGRDFGPYVESVRAVLGVLDTIRGPMLRRHWNSI